MRLVKNEKQKDNLAKYLYDISKIFAAITVVGPIAKLESADRFTFIIGSFATIIFFIFASIIDRNKFLPYE